MKKFIITAAIALSTMSAAAQLPDKGTMLLDAGLGVGCIHYPGTNKTTFTQNVAFEYIVSDGLSFFGQDFGLGIGMAVNNAYARVGRGQIAGIYDYEYNVVKTGWYNDPVTGSRTNVYQVNPSSRNGAGTATTSFKRDDLSFLPQVSLHYSPVSSLDTYLTIGLGVAILNSYIGDKKDLEGFDAQNYREDAQTSNSSITTAYAFNDLDHTEWTDGSCTKAAFGMAFNAGARYWLSDKLALNAKIGLVSAAFKKSMGHSYNIFSMGVTYKF